MKNRCYSELINLKTFNERFEYLKLNGKVGFDTFGFDRYLNQALYKSEEWKKVRRKIILRDNACDLAIDGLDISVGIIIHHMNPITIKQIEDRDPEIFNPEYLICCSHSTHNAIHYGNEDILISKPITRTKGDTKLW